MSDMNLLPSGFIFSTFSVGLFCFVQYFAVRQFNSILVSIKSCYFSHGTDFQSLSVSTFVASRYACSKLVYFNERFQIHILAELR